MINVLEYLENTLKNMPNPEKTAFTGESGALSFKQLFNFGRSVGSFLHGQNIYKQPVVVFMEKSPEMIAAFLGVAYGGNYYVPLDAEVPSFRIRLILETVNPAMIILDKTTSELFNSFNLDFPTVDFAEICLHDVNDTALQNIRDCHINTNPLYVVFTSGSTGIPKGVIASHGNVIDYIENLSDVLDVSENTVFGNQSPLYLDACLKEIYPTLKFGASTYLIPKSLFMFPVKLIEYINENRINTICWVASALGFVAGLGALKNNIPKTLYTIAFGSEVFPIKHFNLWREVLPNARFIHLYGPTEATGMSCYYEVDRDFDINESIPIGKPFANTEIILLDENGNIPEGNSHGEICIRGAGLCLGYFGDTQKTAAAFVQNPQSVFPDIVYKTGDLGYRSENGELYFISRKDHQIKHMGHRIELGEIELMANQCHGIEIACAVFDETEKHIVLYYIANPENTEYEETHLLAILKSLPRYMMPRAIFRLDNAQDFPLTPGGKVDRVKLLEKYRENRKAKKQSRK